MNYYLYIHTNKINGKKYIGITKQIPENRWGYNGANYTKSPHFYSAIKKYGWNNFNHTIVKDNLSKKEACELEKKLIKEYKTQDNNFGYNIQEGGTNPIMSEETKMKISNALMGNKNGYGHPCSYEKKEKIRNSQIGKKLSKEHREKLSISAKKRHVKCTESKKIKLSKSYPNKKRVYCIETKIIYESVHECARALNLQATLISKVCKGKQKTTGKYHFKYYNI